MLSNHRGTRRRAAALVAVGGALALGLVGGPSAHASALTDRAAAAKPDCQNNPDSCKVASVGQDVTRKAVAARRGRSRCEAWVFERYGKSAVGIKLWSYYLDVSWCYRRGRITSATSDPRPDTHAPLWRFTKQLAHRKTGGKRKRSYTVFAQGQFEFCVTKLGCIQDAQPWIRVVARGDGSYDYDTGG